MRTKEIILSLTVLLSACSESDDSLLNREVSHLSISTEIVTTRSFDTGLASETEFRQGNEIGITVCNTRVVSGQYWSSYYIDNYNNSFNLKATYKNGWVMDNDMTLRKEYAKVYAYYPYSQNYKVYAYYPYSQNYKIKSDDIPIRFDMDDAHTVPIDISSYAHGDGQQDYLWGESIDSVNYNNPHARILFKHVLPRITFNITKSEDCNEQLRIRQVILKNTYEIGNRICTHGLLDITRGTVSKEYFENDSIIQVIYGELDVKNPQTCDFLVLPTSFDDDDITLRVGVSVGSNNNIQYYDIAIPGSEWESGKQYTYSVKVNVSTKKENEEAFTPGEKVYMGFNGDNGKPLYWSSKQFSYNGESLFGWGDVTGTHQEQALSRNYSSFTNTNLCMLYYGGVNPLSSISGTQYDIVRAVWKDNWRLPTHSEFTKLINNCTTSVYYISLGEKKLAVGVQFTSKINGNTILFRHTQERCGSTSSYSITTVSSYSGVYWTGTLNQTNKNKADCFEAKYSPTKSVRITSDWRFMGHAILPVTE